MKSSPIDKPALSPDTLRRSSLVDAITDRLRADIIGGDIWPGDPLRSAHIAQRFGTSHIPVREALQRLETEGWIVTTSTGRATAAPIDLDDLKGLYETRRLFECALARIAATQRGDAEVARADHALSELKAIEPRLDDPEVWRRHERFHLALLRPAVNAWSSRLLDQLWRGSERYIRLFGSHFGSIEFAMHEHELLRDAFAAGDAELLATRLHDHLLHTERSVATGYESLVPDGATRPPKRQGG